MWVDVSVLGGRNSRYRLGLLSSAPCHFLPAPNSGALHDFQIVKTYGKTVPDIRPKKKGNENLFPSFTTWRAQVDGKYWFPIYTKADDTLHFSMNDVRIREIVKYENYKKFGSKTRITYEGKELPPGEKNPQPEPQAQQQPPKN